MISDPDDDALGWEGDEKAPDRRPAASRDRAVRGPAPATPAAGTTSTDDEPLGAAALLLLGVLGGVYLLFTIGWILGGLRLQASALFLVPGPMYAVTLVIAAAAPALWFGAAWLLTRRSATWIRLLALVAGALLLVPWPFVMPVGGGAA